MCLKKGLGCILAIFLTQTNTNKQTTEQFPHFWPQLQSWRLLYNRIVPALLTSTPKLEALIQQNSSHTFDLYSKIGGSYTTEYFPHFWPQLQIWRLLYNRIVPALLTSTPKLEEIKYCLFWIDQCYRNISFSLIPLQIYFSPFSAGWP